MRTETKSIILFIALTFGLSSIFWILLPGSHAAQTQHHLIIALMWCPGISALTIRLCKRSGLREMGWQLAPWQFEVAAFLMPVVYACCAYLPVWLSGVGGFPNPDFFSAVSAKFPQLPLRLATAVDVVWISSFAMIPAGFAALGEEIGWRGYLVPQLVATTSKLNTAWISRIVWAVWHYPAILFTGYNNGLPIPYAITCFTIMVIGFAFIMTWFRLRSGSIWPCVILHASHNNFIALFFTPVTTEKHLTKYFIDEFGVALAVTIPLAAFILWRWQQPTDTDAALVPG